MYIALEEFILKKKLFTNHELLMFVKELCRPPCSNIIGLALGTACLVQWIGQARRVAQPEWASAVQCPVGISANPFH